MTSLLERVVARRKLRAPVIGAERSSYEHLRGGNYGAPTTWVRASQEKMGWAFHADPVMPFAYDLALRATRAANDELGVNHELLVAFACIEAAFDGHSLASELSGKSGHGRAFGRAADASRFMTRAVKASPALDGWAHCGVADALVAEWTAGLPEPLQQDGARAARSALVAALLLHAYEFPSSHPDLIALEKARPKQPKAPTEPPPVATRENKQLRDALLAAPGDDKPRLVYADWLQEHADPRAEFIVLQCKTQRTLAGAGGKWGTATGQRPEEVQALKEREVQLLKHHEPKWVEPVRPYIRQWHWWRGFVCHVIGDAAKMLEGWSALTREPLESMKLTGYRPALLAALLRAAPHPVAHWFDFSQSRLSGPSFEALDAPFFSKARVLDLSGNSFRDTRRFAQCELPRLRRLKVSDGELRSLDTLCDAPFFAHLTHLDLGTYREIDLSPLKKATSLQWLECRLTDATSAQLKMLGSKELRVRFDERQAAKWGLHEAFGEPASGSWDGSVSR